MDKVEDITLNKELSTKTDNFMDKLNSAMEYQSDFCGDELTFEWVDEIEFACPYLDNIVRNPKVALIKEEDIVILEKAKKTSVATVKHLARNTRFIDTIDEETDEVTPSKLLIERNEETFNTYENRFIYTIIDHLTRFLIKKEQELDDLKLKDDKVLEYAAATTAGKEKVKIELKISANDLSKDLNNLEKKIEEVRGKLARFKMFIASWRKSEFMMSLEKAHVPLVLPPIKKTNLILKNPNFQIATKLWDFLQKWNEEDDEKKDNQDNEGNNVLKAIMDDAFLMNYYVMDASALSKREQKEKLAEYAIVMINQQIKRVISLLLDSGIKISDQEILDMILNEIKNERTKKSVDTADVKNKFKSEFEEYLEKVKSCLG